jgi:hypothetical protein
MSLGMTKLVMECVGAHVKAVLTYKQLYILFPKFIRFSILPLGEFSMYLMIF